MKQIEFKVLKYDKSWRLGANSTNNANSANEKCCQGTYLFREANGQAILRLAHQRLEEVLAAGRQHGPVPAELLALHQDGHIAQDILLPLVVEAEEDIGTMHCRLIHIHGGFRLLIHGHSAHALEIEAQQRGKGKGGGEKVSLQPSPTSAYREG
ncbi:hypothetical protein EYF80_004372 [Liparis tanakae]|uniref:Uncharacterized protein n=1 Tax=Liparis tanakae TaxID=230148 RepID=A0A4Z2J5A2_9TELE|nr:hypothetical protein EYF80_004372 [Liparis tanakae]